MVIDHADGEVRMTLDQTHGEIWMALDLAPLAHTTGHISPPHSQVSMSIVDNAHAEVGMVIGHNPNTATQSHASASAIGRDDGSCGRKENGIGQNNGQ